MSAQGVRDMSKLGRLKRSIRIASAPSSDEDQGGQANKTDREQHAARINEAWQRGVDAIVETGMRIIDAREGLEHGEYIAMIENDLHCSRAQAFKLVAVASNKTLSNVSHAKHLPSSSETLYGLTVAANKGLDLEAAIESGAIHPKMERKEVKALLPPPVKVQRDDDLENDGDDDDESGSAESDDDQTVWRRGLVFRAQSAAADAAFEDWSRFEVDQQVVEEAKAAADAWSKLARYLEELVGGESEQASSEPTISPLDDIPPWLDRTSQPRGLADGEGAEPADRWTDR